ncbi:N-6 DNA methylase [Undibacterium sp. FT79W]|uniref:N-6 DNA methylase n=1 Tax=Undibacterium sp. FT79W TaxID=2762296 RepID=UPI00164CCD69|nr:N-6 DNA methylase [Undibacterium sp. FT79W]
MTKIESYTEQLTRDEMHFSLGDNNFGYVYPQGNIHDITKIKKLLSKAGGKPSECELDDYSKGGLGSAKPEYVITYKHDPNTIIVIECKKQAKKHATKDLNKPNSFAVDGALYYAKFLKQEYNIIAIGISGTEKEKAALDVYYWPKSQEKPIYQKKLHGIFLTPENYLKAINGEKIAKSYSLNEIRETAIDFHNRLRTIKVTEKQKPIFIAGILIALEDPDFARDYINLSSFSSLINALGNAIDNVLDNSDISKSKRDNIKASFKSIGQNEKLKQIPIGSDNSIAWYIEQLEMKIKPMMNSADSSLDALGVFYHEFVKYSGGDGSGLGIVLTPQHLTEFMCELAEINEDSYVADICCGSSSFLVSAMNHMFKKTSDPHKYENIRKHQLHGIELDPDLYVLAIANMIIRKDGKSNIIHGDCFSDTTTKTLLESAKLRIDRDGKVQNDNIGLTAGLLNPPYSQKDHVELEFVERLLKILVKGSKAAVVVPMSCAIGTKFKDVRKRLFDKHTLKAVFSMPDDIFYPTGTNVCVMVWEAHKPHDSSVKTFFGYCNDDGFVKRKKLGRVDAFATWEEIKSKWLKLYKNSEVTDGLSAKKEVTHSDEWLAEAYMNTDYSRLSQCDFEKTVREYLSYLVKFGSTNLSSNFEKDNISIPLNIENWREFSLTDLFTFSRGSRLTKEDRIAGKLPLVTAGESDLGVKDFILNEDQKIFKEAITVDMFCNTFTHVSEFCCDDNVIALKAKSDMSKYAMLFINTVIQKDKYRYQYGRQYRQKNLIKHKIVLPVNPSGEPDWSFMESYIKALPYADRI